MEPEVIMELIKGEFDRLKVEAEIEETPEEDGFTYTAKSGKHKITFSLEPDMLDVKSVGTIRSRAYSAAYELNQKIAGTWKPPEER